MNGRSTFWRRVASEDPVRRWRQLSNWYGELVAIPPWEFQAPMIGLTAWIAEQPFAASLFPFTSHAALCVSLEAGYRFGSPFLSCEALVDGQCKLELWEDVGRSRGKRVVPFEQAREVFREFAGLLHGMSGCTEQGGADG